MNEEIFWNASIEELQKGYVCDSGEEAYHCLICGESFVKGIIYQAGEVFFEAEKAAENHVTVQHGSMADYLLNMNKRYTGLTDHQKDMMAYFQQGFTDKEIAGRTGSSASTVRNHRFKLREKEKQAKVFLAMMGLLNKRRENKPEFIDIHRGATMIDERFAITEEEKEKVLTTYFTEDGKKLKQFPSKEKRKIVVLQQMIQSFEEAKTYTEKEVNAILKSFYDDFATIRRYLIEYGFLDRSKDCSAYWVKR